MRGVRRRTDAASPETTGRGTSRIRSDVVVRRAERLLLGGGFGGGGGGFDITRSASIRSLLGASRLGGGGGVLRGRFFAAALGGGSGDGGLFVGGGLHVGGLATPAHRFADCRLGCRFRRGHGRGGGATATRRGRRGSLSLGAHALLPLPSCADASDLVVGEHTQMAADGHVHLTKKCDDFFGGHAELVGQLTD